MKNEKGSSKDNRGLRARVLVSLEVACSFSNTFVSGMDLEHTSKPHDQRDRRSREADIARGTLLQCA